MKMSQDSSARPGLRIYRYNDLRSYSRKVADVSNKKPIKVKSNLCTFYYKDKNQFCGNYCSRRGKHGYTMHRRCWRHKRTGTYSASIPPLVLLMISSSERMYNRNKWIKFLVKCEDKGVPIEFIYYHEDMYSSTERHPLNLVSRFRPFPDEFGSTVLQLRNDHGGLNFTQSYLRMLEYGLKIPYSARCIVLTERTIPIRSPVKLYKRALASKCYVDISYNVAYGPTPSSIVNSGHRGRAFPAVNNHCQGLFTTSFLKEALPTIPVYCEKFGIAKLRNGTYNVCNPTLYESWRVFTGANPSEYWLLNSYLFSLESNRPIEHLKRHMDKTVENDQWTIAEVPHWRDGVKRTYIFKDPTTNEHIAWYDDKVKSYYKGLHLPEDGVSLLEIVRYVRQNKKRALFFRQVELP